MSWSENNLKSFLYSKLCIEKNNKKKIVRDQIKTEIAVESFEIVILLHDIFADCTVLCLWKQIMKIIRISHNICCGFGNNWLLPKRVTI